jgi:DNA-binding NtrC family response regulator
LLRKQWNAGARLPVCMNTAAWATAGVADREFCGRGKGEMVARHCRILVIEDNEHVSALLDQVISVEGYEVELVRPPLDETADLDFAAYDLALIDLSLPAGHDGFATAQRAAAAGIGVILMSGDRTLYDAAEMALHPFLEKPFRLAHLIETIHQVLERNGTDCERRKARSA